MFKIHRKTKNRGEVRFDDFGLRSEIVGVVHVDSEDRVLEILKNDELENNATWLEEFEGNIEVGDFLVDDNNQAYVIKEGFKDLYKLHDSTFEIYYYGY